MEINYLSILVSRWWGSGNDSTFYAEYDRNWGLKCKVMVLIINFVWLIFISIAWILGCKAA